MARAGTTTPATSYRSIQFSSHVQHRDSRSETAANITSAPLSAPRDHGRKLIQRAERSMRDSEMSNVIKFERPPEEKPQKTKREASPILRKGLIWLALVAAFGLAWVYFTFVGGSGAPG